MEVENESMACAMFLGGGGGRWSPLLRWTSLCVSKWVWVCFVVRLVFVVVAGDGGFRLVMLWFWTVWLLESRALYLHTHTVE